ncbi:hypothetical protein BD310DRAFT_968959 [Dichomitus squalens]|uniref:Uncharacterized protein n=1 Tax=Dichomitus squalens TaxID=114155 RepID=A0A4Q9PPC8_9APHY|nr:hypothetical protein BD310DRAFT_968959 [Dichomitus squalens]
MNESVCQALSRLYNITMVFPYITWIAFSAFRAYALSNRTIIIGLLVLVLSSGFAALTVWQIIEAPVDDLPPPLNCFSPITFNKQISIGACYTLQPAARLTKLLLADAVMKGAYVVGELIIIALTLKRTSPILVTSQHQPPQALASTLLQNSVICFSIPLVFNLIVLVNAFTVTSENENIIRSRVMIIVGNLRDPVTAILVSRFLLDLAEYSLRAHASDNTWANIVTSDVTVHPSDVLSELPPDQRRITIHVAAGEEYLETA